jgi:hypothetical protein
MFVGLAILTYYAAKAIETEDDAEEDAAEH